MMDPINGSVVGGALVRGDKISVILTIYTNHHLYK
jgi:hypothetical protein